MTELRELVINFKFTDDLWVIILPVILITVDLVTGFVNAWAKGEIKSSILRKGLAKKFGEFVVVILGEIMVTALELPNLVSSGVSLYIVIMELISVCENLDKMGVPIPSFVKKALAETSEKINKDDDTDKEDEGEK